MPIAHTRYVEEVYGIGPEEAQSIPVEVQEIMAKLILVISAADGLSRSEERHFSTWLEAIGHPAALSRQLFLFDAAHADVEEMLEHWKALLHRSVAPRTAARLRRVVLYEGVRVATACDGYSPQEQEAMRTISSTLGLSHSILSAIEAHVGLELLLERSRNDHPSAALHDRMVSYAHHVRRFLLDGE